MKTTPHVNKYYWGLPFLALLFLAFACSPEPDLGADSLEAINAKSNKSVLKTLVKGANFKMANGLDIGKDGNLYVASYGGQFIAVMDKNSGKIIDRITDRVDSPDDLIFGPDGSLYWTDLALGQVGRLDPDGNVTKHTDNFPGAALPGVNPIRFNAEGRLFVALDFLGDGLYEFDPEFEEAPKPVIECPGGFCLGFLNSFDFGPDGRLYGPLFALNLVIAIDISNSDEWPYENVNPFDLSNTAPIEILAGGAGEFSNPAATKFGPDGLLYILDQSGKLFTLNVETKALTTITSRLDPGLDNMTFDEDGSLYMTNNDEGWVAEILLPSGQARYLSPGGIIRPQGLVAMEGPNNQDMLFEADLFNLRKFNGTSGQQIEQYKGFLIPEGPPGDPTTLILPMNISPDGDNLIVTSWFSAGVQVWNSQNQSVENISYGTEGDDKLPIDAVRAKGKIFISDLLAGGVVMEGSSNPIVPLTASGLASDGETLYAADWGSGNIFKVDLSGSSPVVTLVYEGLINPEGLALDLEGRLLVVETGTSSLHRIDLATGVKETLVEGLELSQGGIPGGAPPTWFFDAVAVGPSGDIYVSGGGKNVIYKIKANKVR